MRTQLFKWTDRILEQSGWPNRAWRIADCLDASMVFILNAYTTHGVTSSGCRNIAISLKVPGRREHECNRVIVATGGDCLPGMDFEFVDPGILRGDGFEVFRFSTMPPDISRGTVPAYDFRIRINSQIVGQVNLRVGLTEHIKLYAGNLGYKVDPPYRGRHLAARAINLLLPVARHHQMGELWLCCNPDNWASRKTCERVGAELVEIIEVPPGNDLYERGDRANCRYRLRL